MIKVHITIALLMISGLLGCTNQPKTIEPQSQAVTELEPSKSIEEDELLVSSDPKLPVADTSQDRNPDFKLLENTIQRFEVEQPHHEFTQKHFVYDPQRSEADNLWNQLSHHLYLAPAYKEQYQSYINYYLKRPAYLKRVSIRAKPYLHHILNEIEKRKLPYEIALLPIVESGYYPFARSYVSANGLWQFMPATGYMFGLKKDWWYNGRQDVIKSTDAALKYLQKLYVMNDYDWLLALASYNGGIGNVLKAQRKYLKKHPNGVPNFWNIRPYLPKETRHYVPQLLAISHIVNHHQELGIELEPIYNEPYFKQLNITKQLNLVKIAEITDSELKMIELLNPGFLRKATPPKGKYQLLLPNQTAHLFLERYQSDPTYFKVNWAKHKIKNGESLSVIAVNYKTSVKEIKKLNGLKTSRIRAGKTILIPVPEKYAQTVKTKSAQKNYNGKKYFHTVQSGESLWSIARYYNISTRKLCEWNRISVREPLSVGKKLEIRSNKYGKKLSYIIKNGDSLWTVAQKHSVSTSDLRNWNGIRKSQILYPGTRLDIWVKQNI